MREDENHLYAPAAGSPPYQPRNSQLPHTCVQVQLTEEETEYSVVAVKHVFDAAIALQFTCSNTVAEQILENVTVAVDLADAVRGLCSKPWPLVYTVATWGGIHPLLVAWDTLFLDPVATSGFPWLRVLQLRKVHAEARSL